ncbi:hypothetical protein Taro_003935, partial [Colocasia esculenta]|nr:hypothetical protein [Colocasia esculenta]
GRGGDPREVTVRLSGPLAPIDFSDWAWQIDLSGCRGVPGGRVLVAVWAAVVISRGKRWESDVVVCGALLAEAGTPIVTSHVTLTNRPPSRMATYGMSPSKDDMKHVAFQLGRRRALCSLLLCCQPHALCRFAV